MEQPVHMYGKAMNMHRELLHRRNVLCVSASVVRRDAFEAVGGFFTARRILSGDYDLWIRLSEAYDFYIVPEVLCHYRILEHSAIHGSRAKEFGAQRNIIEMHRHRFSDAEYRARMARLHADWADSALWERDPDAWQVWRRALSLDPARGRLWAMGARAAARRLLKPVGP
jgi:GT2 family glycosyltransferase